MLLQVLSVVGAGLILVAYLALQRGWWDSHNALYLWCNLVGSVLLTLVAVADRRVGFIVLEAAWAAVSLHSLLRGSSKLPAA